jgi:hypothetical protein
MSRPSGAVVWRGRSLIDGKRIAVVVTFESVNRKTGPMLQCWILTDAVDPVTAVATGRDRSICGGCVHRGDGTGAGRSCYVNVGQAPLSVWSALRRGVYPPLRRVDLSPYYGQPVRLGAYGDPGAVPVAVWRALLRSLRCERWTGYTHQWRRRPALRALCQASCDSIAEAAEARARGWRVFVTLGTAQPAPEGTIECPAQGSTPSTTCSQCALCAGTSDRTARAPSIAITLHGSGAVHAERRIAAQ